MGLSIGLTIFLNDYWAQEDAQSDFLRDTKISLEQLKQQAALSNLTLRDYIKIEQDNFHFDIHWHEMDDLLCIDCQLLVNQKTFKLYQLDSGEMLAQYDSLTSHGYITIQDRSEPLLFLEDEIESNDDPEAWLPLFVITSALIAMALGLYYPIKQLENKIEQLNQTQKTFGQGQLDIRANTELPSPLNELAVNFNLMADNIEQTLIENQVFAHAVPHELRTPLSRIQLAAGIIASSKQTSENQELLNNIDTYIEDINSLIKQLLLLSKLNQSMGPKDVQSQHKDINEINIADFVMERISSLPLNREINLNTVIANNDFITCQSSYLRLVLDNLITNAFRYCHSSVSISITKMEGCYQLVIEDDGIGIDKTDYDKIFLPFSRIDKSRAKATGGLGLGLAIAQAAANKLSASITVNQSKFGGARFNLTIPTQK